MAMHVIWPLEQICAQCLLGNVLWSCRGTVMSLTFVIMLYTIIESLNISLQPSKQEQFSLRYIGIYLGGCKQTTDVHV